MNITPKKLKIVRLLTKRFYTILERKPPDVKKR
jgi:hypothetical protein